MLSISLKAGFWSDPADQSSSETNNTSEVVNSKCVDGLEVTAKELDDSTCRTYRAHFLQSEHFNFCRTDDMLGPFILSLKYYRQSEGSSNHTRVILRLATGTRHKLVEYEADDQESSPLELAKILCPELSIESLQPILCPNTAELLLSFDEHVLVNSFKFGVLYQREGQESEEAIFGNQSHSPAFEKFLDMIGSRVALSGHSGYRGGLDTEFGQTGQHSVYTKHMDKEIMYHVATLLPYTATDPQQLERKRHIGNDIVSLVFQEGSTPFSPDMVTSHFLHAYIVVQPQPGDDQMYRVAVTARSDVPNFGPSLPSPPVFKRGPEFREWILNKLINAEISSYKADKFKQLKQRTQEALLTNLVGDLLEKTEKFLGSLDIIKTPTAPAVPVSNSFFRAVKKVFGSRRKSQSSLFSQIDTPSQSSMNLYEENDSGCTSLSSRSTDPTGSVKLWNTGNDSFDTVEEEVLVKLSDSQMNEPMVCNQTLMETSSTEVKDLTANEEEITISIDNTVISNDTLIKLQQELASLKMDKLELIRHNMDVQQEANKLRERELKLQTDLIRASRELNSLRNGIEENTGNV